VKTFTLAASGPGADSPLIQVPVDQPIFIIGTDTTSGDRGTGFISLEAALTGASAPFLEWSGVNSTTSNTGPPTLTGGFSGALGTKMVAMDFDGGVTLRVGKLDPATGFASFFIHNGEGDIETVSVWVLLAPPPT
jgi:hypothetical protein